MTSHIKKLWIFLLYWYIYCEYSSSNGFSYVVMYDRAVNPPTEQILKIVSLGQQGNRVDIQCLGSLFFFSTNLLFAYEKRDGSLLLADDGTYLL